MTIPLNKNLILKCLYNNNTTLFKNFFFILFLILVVLILMLCNQLFSLHSDVSLKFEKVNLNVIDSLPEVKLLVSSNVSAPRNPNCTRWDCFNIYRCGHTGHDRIAVYVYPLYKYLDEDGVPVTEPISKEYYALLKAVVSSKYYTSNPNEACIFVPSIDTLNQDRLRLNWTSKALASLPFWGNNGENHVIFNMISGGPPDFSPIIELNVADALMVAAGFDTYSFRRGFDIAIPVFSPMARLAEIDYGDNDSDDRPYLLVAVHPTPFHPLPPSTLHLTPCPAPSRYTVRCDSRGRVHSYPAVLRLGRFCLAEGAALHESLAAGCVPVAAAADVLPLAEVLDWRRVALLLREGEPVEEALGGVSVERERRLRNGGRWVYERYFGSMGKMALAVLDVLQDRVWRYRAKVYDDWNIRPEERNMNPLFLPLTAPRSQGFTAVILTYDRVDSLFLLIERLAKVPSLTKVLVVWNNQEKSPPALDKFPQITKPIKVIRTKANKLSNRFYPYREIETEAILHIDDDIVMLTADEVEFGYEVWREFPDRIVGFPSRTHVWDNVTGSWKYESEWTNEISMVLTGAAFLHKYWSYLYTTGLPANVRDWVDEHMNCEDIAMNFLVANVTKKPPIKVTPRKKFKCPECANNEMLSADFGHMVERSQCVDRFARVFGSMPLKSVEFRADPVLFKDSFPEKLKRFNDIGSL